MGNEGLPRGFPYYETTTAITIPMSFAHLDFPFSNILESIPDFLKTEIPMNFFIGIVNDVGNEGFEP